MLIISFCFICGGGKVSNNLWWVLGWKSDMVNLQEDHRARISFMILCIFRYSLPEVFLVKGVVKIRSKFTGEYPCRSAVSIKLLCNFIQIALRHWCSPVNLLHIFRTSFNKNTYGGLLMYFWILALLVFMYNWNICLKCVENKSLYLYLKSCGKWGR